MSCTLSSKGFELWMHAGQHMEVHVLHYQEDIMEIWIWNDIV